MSVEPARAVVSLSQLRDQAIELVKLTHEGSNVWDDLLKLNTSAKAGDESGPPPPAGDILEIISELLVETRHRVVQLIERMQVRI